MVMSHITRVEFPRNLVIIRYRCLSA